MAPRRLQQYKLALVPSWQTWRGDIAAGISFLHYSVSKKLIQLALSQTIGDAPNYSI